jgi:hypothetical protein
LKNLNIIKDKLMTENKQIIFFNNLNDLPDVGRLDTIYYVINSDDDVSYQWDGLNYITLTVGNLVKFYNLINVFPTPGDEDILYVHNKYNHVYGWSNDINQYFFIKVATSMLHQILYETEIVYTSKSVPPEEVQLNTIYRIGFDDEYYVYNSLQKINLLINDILERFSPFNGQSWNDVLGKYYPELPIPNPYKDYKEDMVQLTFDVNTDGKIDTARNSERLGGKTPDYFLNFKNLINVPEFVTQNIVDDQKDAIDDINDKIDDTESQIGEITNGKDNTPQKPDSPFLTVLYTDDRKPYVRIIWNQVLLNSDGTNIQDLEGYRILKSDNINLANPVVTTHTALDSLISYDSLVQEYETWYYAIQAYDKFKNYSAISSVSEIIIRDELAPNYPLSVTGFAVFKTVFLNIKYPDNNIGTKVEVYYVQEGIVRETKLAGDPDFPVNIFDLVYSGSVVTKPSFEASFNGYAYVRVVSVNHNPSEFSVSNLIQLEKIDAPSIENGAITLEKLALDLELTGSYIKDGAITLSKINESLGLTENYLANGTIGLSKLQQNLGLTGDYIADGTLGSALLDQNLKNALYVNGDINNITTIAANAQGISTMVRKIDGIQYVDNFDVFSGYITKYNSQFFITYMVEEPTSITENKIVLQIHDFWTAVKDPYIEFNKDVMYVMRLRARQYTTNDNSKISVGFECSDINKVFLGYVYFVAKDADLIIREDWKEFIGYLNGFGANIDSVGTLSAPSNVIENTHYIRPVISIKYASEDIHGACQIDYHSINILDESEMWTNVKQNAKMISLTAEEINDTTQWRSQFTVQPSQINQVVTTVEDGVVSTADFEILQDQISSTVSRVDAISYNEYFDTFENYLTRTGFTSTRSIINELTAKNGKVLQVNGYWWAAKNILIPFDPTATYIMRFRVRQIINSSVANNTKVYAGFEGIAENGETIINTLGENTYGSAYYCTALGNIITTSDGWKEFIGFLSGYGDNNSSVGTIESPMNVKNGVRYLRPMFIVNHQNGDGTCQIDFQVIKAESSDSWSQIKQNIDNIALLTQFKDDNSTLLSGITVSPDQINEVVAEVFINGDIQASKIDVTATSIMQEVSLVNDELAKRGISVPSKSLYFNFDKNLTPTNGKELIGNTVASIRNDQGVFGGAMAVEIPTANLITDQTFFQLASSGTICTRELVTSGEWNGWYKVRVTKIELSNGIFSYVNNAVSSVLGDDLSASIDFYSPTGNIYPFFSGTYGVSEIYTLNNSKYRKGVTWKNNNGSASMYIYFRHKTNTAQPSIDEVFYYKDVQIEKTPFCTSFTPTSRISGLFNVGGDSLPSVSAIFFKAKVLSKTGTVQLMSNANSNDATYIRANLDLNRIEFAIYNGTQYTSFKTVDSSFWNSYHSYGCTYARNVSKFFIDGVLIETATINYGRIYRSNLTFGSEPNGTNVGGVLFDELIIVPHGVSDTDQTLWASQITPFYDISESVTQWTRIEQESDRIDLIALESGDNATWISRINIEPEEINSTVAEIYPNGTLEASSIEMLSDSIISTVSKLNGRSINKPDGAKLINFDSGYNTTDGIVPLVNNYTNLQKGKFGNALVVESPTTNLCTIGDSQWNLNKSNYSTSMTITTQTSGMTTSAKVTFGDKIDPALSGWHVFEYKGLPSTFDLTKQYTLSLKLKFTYGNACSVSIRKADGTNVVMDTVTAINDKSNDWIIFTKTFTPLIVGNVPIIYINGNPGTVVEIADPQIEQKSFPTSFVNGTRGYADIRYPRSLFNPESGTIGFWFNPLSKNPDQFPSLVTLGDYNVSAEDWFSIYWGSGWSSANSISFSYRPMNMSPYPSISVTYTFQPYTWYYVVARWDKTTNKTDLKLYAPDIIKTGSNTFPSNTPTFKNENNNFIRIGRTWGTSTAYVNAAFDDFFISTKWIEDSVIDNLFESNAPLYDSKETSTQWSKITQTEKDITSTVARVDGINFTDYFETYFDGKYNKRYTPTNISVVSDSTATGGKALQVQGYGWFSLNENIPFDPDSVYVMKFRVKQTVNPTVVTNNKVYVGFECVGSDGVTLINTSGLNNFGSAHYFVTVGTPITADGTWKEFTGYLKGYGTNYFNGTLDNYANVRDGVKYIRPMFVVNYQNGDGTVLVDYVIVRADSANVWTQIKQTEKDITLRAMTVDVNGNPVANAQLQVSSVDGGMILLDAKKVIATGSIETPLIKSGAIETDKLAALAVTAEKVAAKAITTEKLEVGAVKAENIDVGAVETDKLAALAVTAEKVAAKAITTEKLEVGAVKAENIDVGAVETDKLAALAVTAEKVAAKAITTEKLEVGAVKAENIDVGAVTADKFALGYNGLLTKPSDINGKVSLWHYDRDLRTSDGIDPVSSSMTTLTSWGKFGNGISCDVPAANLWNKKYEWHIPVDGINTSLYSNISTNIQSDYTLSCEQVLWPDDLTINPRMSLRINYSDGTNTLSSLSTSLFIKDGVRRYYYTTAIRNTAKTVVSVDAWILDHSSTTGKHIDVYNIQLEAKSFPTAFVAGTRNTTGATNGIKYDPTKLGLKLTEGTIGLWFYPRTGFFGANNLFARLAGHSTNVNKNEIQVMRSSSSSKIAFAISNNDGQPMGSFWQYLESNTSLSPNNWYHIVCTWSLSKGKYAIYINGIKENEKTLSSTYMPSVYGSFDVGFHSFVTSREANSIIDELILLPYAATDNEIAFWHKSNSPFYDTGEKIIANTVTIDRNGITSVNDDGDYSILDGGALKFYKSGEENPYWYSRRVKHGTATNGQLIPLGFNVYPQIITSIASARTYTRGVSGSLLGKFFNYSDSNQLTQAWANVEGDPINGYNARIFIQTVVEAGKTTTFAENIIVYTNSSYGATSAITANASPDNTTKLTVLLYGSTVVLNGVLLGGYIHSRLYYQKVGTTQWIKFWDGAIKSGSYQQVSTFVQAGSYKIKIECLNDMDYSITSAGGVQIKYCNAHSYLIIPNDDVNVASYIAIEGGAEGGGME